MPDKMGRLGHREKIWAQRFAETGDATYAAEKAGYSSPQPRGAQNLAKPDLVAEARRLTIAKLSNEILPQATKRHLEALLDPKVTGQSLNRLIELAYKYGLGDQLGGREKEAHEMTAEELAQAIGVLQRVASDKAKPIIEHEPPPGVFA